ncbi:helix-turn-helix domain-containing protein [Mesorhizobium sp. 10J20-29]
MSLEASQVSRQPVRPLANPPRSGLAVNDVRSHGRSTSDGATLAGTGDDSRQAAISIPLSAMGAVLAVSPASPRWAGSEAAEIGPVSSVRGRASSDSNVIELRVGAASAGSLGRLRTAGAVSDISVALPSDPVVERLSRALAATEASGGDFAGVYADAVKFAMVARLLSLRGDRDADNQTTRRRVRHELPKWRMKRVLEYVSENLGQQISLAAMASAAGLSKMHFAAQFRLATGMRPHEFVLRRRIEYAQQLLSETRTSIIEVALSVGFQTQAHFTTVFKRFVGETPYRWRCAVKMRN